MWCRKQDLLDLTRVYDDDDGPMKQIRSRRRLVVRRADHG